MTKLPVGLSEDTIRTISAIKSEPKWMLDLRLQAYQEFCRLPMPNFGPDLSQLDFQNLSYYNTATNQTADRWDSVPANIRKIYDQIGLPQAEQRYLAGAQAQYNSGMVYQKLKESWEEQGVIFLDTDTALHQYPDLFKKYFGTVVSYRNNKLAALNTAVWSGGSFIYCPPGVHLSIPLQAYFRINISNLGQFERSLIIADEGATIQYVEGCTAPIFRTDSLHDAVVEIIARPHSRVRYTAIQNWSTNIYSLTNQCMRIEHDAVGEWIDGNIGAKATMKYPALLLAGHNASGSILSLSTATGQQYQDNGGKAIHLAPNTSSTIVAKSISRDGGTCTYRGEVVIGDQAINAKSSTKCDALLMDDRSISNTFPTNTISRQDATISHEATVSRIDQNQLFYLMNRGLDENEATSLIVSGFIEPIVRNLPMEYASELNKLINLSTQGAVG